MDKFEKFEKAIKKKHVFAWNLKYQEKTRSKLNDRLVVHIAIKTFERLGWELVYQEEKLAKARIKNRFDSWSEVLTVSCNIGELTVRSESLQGTFWDYGSNSKRVKLFIHAFSVLEKELDPEEARKLTEEIEAQDNWDDYVIPETLIKPLERIKPNIYIPALGIAVMAVVMAFLAAYMVDVGIYIIGLYEVVIAVVLALGIKYLIQLGNYTHFLNLRYMTMGGIFLLYFLLEYFRYVFIAVRFVSDDFGFIDFLGLRLSHGLTIKSLDLGMWGLLGLWVFQLVMTYLIVSFKTAIAVIEYQIGRVPLEVTDFVWYLVIKGSDENRITAELDKRGWSTEQCQQEVFEAIAAHQGASEINRGG